MSATSVYDQNEIPPVELPFVESDAETSERRKRAINARPLLDEKKDAAPLNESGKDEGTEKASRGRGRRILICVALFLVLIVGCVIAIYFFLGSSATRKPTVRVTTDPNKKPETSYGSDEEKYNAAIANLVSKEGNKDNPLNPLGGGDNSAIDPKTGQPVTDLSGLPKSTTAGSTGVDSGRTSLTETGRVQPEPLAPANSNAASDAASSNTGQRPSLSASSSTAGRSTLFSTSRLANKGEAATRSGNSGDANRGGSDRSESRDGVAVPTFGSMLPVRTLGMIYTLRSSGSLVRFELTRDISGRGWSLKRGTVIVGVVRSSDNDRAFISMVGFIDGDTGGFVKVTGDLLSGDGASGIKGKKKKVSSGFSRVLSRLGDAGLNILSTIAAGAGRGTIVISDAYTRGTAPLTSELNGVLGSGNRQEFVEIKAGTPCYVMITQLPDEIHGIDALASMSSESLNNFSDSGKPRRATGLSEIELAELISRGDEAEIRAALPKMTPEMRRIALAVLSGGGDR
jgi:hypothetical protein